MNKKSSGFDPGQEICSWEAYDYHPHKRGWLWITLFCLIFFGGAAWALSTGDWVMALTFFVVVAVYFWTHRRSEGERHLIRVFEKGVLIGEQNFVPFEKLKGYWFIYDTSAAILNLEYAKGGKKLSLQMGETPPEVFRAIFKEVNLPEVEDQEESFVDLWIRALKL